MPQLADRGAPAQTLGDLLPPLDSGRGETRPFQSEAWLRHWVAHRAGRVQLFPVVVDGGATAAYLGLFRVAGLRVLRLLGSGDSDFNGLVTTRDVAAAWDSVVQELERRRREWDLLHLHSVAEVSAIQSACDRYLRRPGSFRMYDACPLIRLAPSWTQFIRGRRSLRKEVNRWLRRLEESGPVSLQSVATPVAQDVLDTIVDIERASWKWDLGLAAFKPGSQRNFLFGVLRDAHAPARIWVLTVGDRPAAFLIALESATRWYGYLAAYRQEFSNSGSLLLARVVEAAHTAGCATFSLLRGDAPYKNDWADEREDVYEIVYASNPRGELGALSYKLRWQAAANPLFRRAHAALKAVDKR